MSQSQEFNNFGYVTTTPCTICNSKRDNRLHPILLYSVCILHFKLNPQNILKLINKKDEKMKVAVYGTLRKGQRAHYILQDEIYLGKFESEPKYTMASIGNSFPGVKLEGNTSVTFEVYDEISLKVLEKLNQLEGYKKHGDPNNMYDRKFINTPWGKALFYVYNSNFNKNNTIITSGDWVDYHTNKLKFKETYD